MTAIITALKKHTRRAAHPVRRNVALLPGHAAFENMIFVLPVLMPYYHDVIGLNFRDFLIGEIAFAAVLVVMEVPSGWLSDMWSRRLTMALGSLFDALGFGLLLVADSFADAIVAQMVIGIGVSLISGTNTALLYDTLHMRRLSAQYRRLEGRRHGIALYMVGAAALAGGFLYKIDPRLPVILTAAACLIAGVLALAMHEPARVRRAAEKHPLRDLYETVRYAVHGHKSVAVLILFTAILLGTTNTGFWMQQPYWRDLNIDVIWFGVLTCIGFVLAGSSSMFGHMLEKRFSHKAIFAIALISVAGAYLLAGLLPGLHGIALLFCSSMAYGLYMPIIQQAINDNVDGARRATILSTASLSGRIVFMALGFITSQIEHYAGIAHAVTFLGVFLIAGGCIVLPLVFRQMRQAGRVAGMAIG